MCRAFLGRDLLLRLEAHGPAFQAENAVRDHRVVMQAMRRLQENGTKRPSPHSRQQKRSTPKRGRPHCRKCLSADSAHGLDGSLRAGGWSDGAFHSMDTAPGAESCAPFGNKMGGLHVYIAWKSLKSTR